MASLNKTPHGYTVQVITADRKRKSIRLGTLPKPAAQAIQHWIERLNALDMAGLPPDEDCTRWLARIGDELHQRIANAGLAQERSSRLLAASLRAYICEHSTGKANATVAAWERAAGNLVDYFGADCPLRDVTPARARAWREHMLLTLAKNTVARRTGHAAQFFAVAVKNRQLAENPFTGLPMTVEGGLKEHFVTAFDAEAILAACPNDELRLYFALARYGGLRLPSEASNLMWSDVLWQAGKIRTESPKTASRGKSERMIPLFKSLEPYLLACFHVAPEGDGLVFPALDGQDMSDKLKKAIRKAGLAVWPKLLMNLRSSRQVELLHSGVKEHVVAAWMGHSEAVARTHYSQIIDADFDMAIRL